MKFPLIKIIGEAIEESARDYLRVFIKQRYSAFLTEHKIDPDTMHTTTLWKFKGGEYNSVSAILYGTGGLYLYTVRDRFKNITNQEATVNFSETHLRGVFECFGYQAEREEFVAFFIRYIKLLDIPWSLKNHQIVRIREVYLKSDDAKEIIDWEEPADPIDIDDLQALKKRLVGENDQKWYVYFYGYDLLVNPKKRGNNWLLVRLVLEFKPAKNDRDLPVFIANTEHPQHPDYDGYTDFKSSTKKVLVLNFKTSESEPKRQLNIKLFVDTASGSLFVGQYLNYEVTTGRIISGDIILEQAKESANGPVVPLTFSIKDVLEDTDGYTSIKHLRALLPALKSSFRDTKPVVYNSSEEEWQYYYLS